MSYGNPYFASAEYRCLLVIDEDKCIGCLTCVTVCPRRVIGFSKSGAHAVIKERDKCLSCYQCIEGCQVRAISVMRDAPSADMRS